MIRARRAALRVLSSIEQKEKSKEKEVNVARIRVYAKKVEKELNDICTDVLHVLDDHLINSSTSVESKVYYGKMKGDYWRYLAEFSADEERKATAEQALAVYQQASKLAREVLAPTHPIRLSLALNFSVFYDEIQNDRDMASVIAKEAFDRAMAGVDDLTEDSYKDSTVIMQLLRENLALWTVEEGVSEAETDD